MSNIGIVLAGGAAKGAYEIGCLRAIEECFGRESIKCVSSASIGAIIAQAYGMGRLDALESSWKSLDIKKHGKTFFRYSGSDLIRDIINGLIKDADPPFFEHYVCIWNYTAHRVEYLPYHTYSGERLEKYLHGAVTIPLFGKIEAVDGSYLIDGAILDNIPAYPLLDKELDYIFCIYFDNCNYFFENEEFNSKVIKLYDFPNLKMFEPLTFKVEDFDSMVEYGYSYTKRVIGELFADPEKQAVYSAIAEREKRNDNVYKPRFTAEIVLKNVNSMTRRYSKRLSNRIVLPADPPAENA